jgi:hypothetical protein
MFVRATLTAVAMMLCGCVSTQQTLSNTAAVQYRAIVVVPVEAPPLLVHPGSDADRTAIKAAYITVPEGGGGAFVPLMLMPNPLAAVGGTAFLASLAVSSFPREGESLVLTSAKPSPWMPTAMLAGTAAQLLQASGAHSASVIQGYAQLPITDRSVNVMMENWYAPIRRWYNSGVSMADYGQLPAGTDAVVEIGIINYEYFSNRLLLQVMVKVVDPKTQRIVARSREGKAPKGSALAAMLANQGQPMRDLINSTANAMLSKCLEDVGLVPRSHLP